MEVTKLVGSSGREEISQNEGQSGTSASSFTFVTVKSEVKVCVSYIRS